MGKYKDLTNQTFDRLTVIERDIKSMENLINTKGECRNTLWICRCECGNYKYGVTKPILDKGIVKSCGCLRKELAKQTKKNKYIEHDDYYIGLASNDENIEFIFDKDDYEKICKYTWRYDNGGYMSTTLSDNTRLALHKLIMNTNSKEITDHINRNRLDNRRKNLRIVNSRQNVINKSIPSNNTSGIIGVIWDKERNKWMSQIVQNRKNIHLGRFTDKQEAIKARLEAELKYFGKEFAPQRHLFEEYGVLNE